MPLRFSALDATDVAAVRAGGPDANGQPAEAGVSDGGGNPCRLFNVLPRRSSAHYS